MAANFTLSRDRAALLVIDVQDKLFPLVDRECEVMAQMLKAVKGFQILHLPIFATEQYPSGLGSTVEPLKEALGPTQHYYAKTTFSCAGDTNFKNLILSLPIEQWVLVGIEAHVCVLQTAKQLLGMNKTVTVLNDAITSRSVYDFSTAIAEMRDIGIRVTSTETVLFELTSDAKAAEFKQISQLVK